jgi:hypothetical protein
MLTLELYVCLTDEGGEWMRMKRKLAGSSSIQESEPLQEPCFLWQAFQNAELTQSLLPKTYLALSKSLALGVSFCLFLPCRKVFLNFDFMFKNKFKGLPRESWRNMCMVGIKKRTCWFPFKYCHVSRKIENYLLIHNKVIYNQASERGRELEQMASL